MIETDSKNIIIKNNVKHCGHNECDASYLETNYAMTGDRLMAFVTKNQNGFTLLAAILQSFNFRVIHCVVFRAS